MPLKTQQPAYYDALERMRFALGDGYIPAPEPEAENVPEPEDEAATMEAKND